MGPEGGPISLRFFFEFRLHPIVFGAPDPLHLVKDFPASVDSSMPQHRLTRQWSFVTPFARSALPPRVGFRISFLHPHLPPHVRHVHHSMLCRHLSVMVSLHPPLAKAPTTPSARPYVFNVSGLFNAPFCPHPCAAVSNG